MRLKSLLVICSLLMACLASPALAAERGNAADFEGVWDTVLTGPNGESSVLITLHVSGTAVTGYVVSKMHPEFNSTIAGTVDPSKDGTAAGGVFAYQWGDGRTGSFIISVDGWMGGFVSYPESSKKYVWEGIRISAPTPKPQPTQKGVKVTAEVTGYDVPGGNDKCYLNPGDTATLLGVEEGDPNWKHLQGTGACDGRDFWVYDEGVLEQL